MAEFVTVDVFTVTKFGGNPLAVFPDAREIDESHLQSIAREFNYSETTFVYPPRDPRHTAEVRIFTPSGEVPFAGHPNVGTAFVLGRQKTIFGGPVGTDLIFEEKAGLVRLDLQRVDGEVVGAGFVAPQALELGEIVDSGIVADCLSLPSDKIVTEAHLPRIASVGLPFVMVEVEDIAALASARPNISAFLQARETYSNVDGHFSTFMYARPPADPSRLRARMFAPLDAISEDPATGSAAAALGAFLCYLVRAPKAKLRARIEQGIEMGRPSMIEVEAEKNDGVIGNVQVSGRCVLVTNGSLFS